MKKRTGAFAFLAIGRSDVGDTLRPTCVGVGEALQYFPRILHTTPEQFAVKFDNYTVNKDTVGLDLSSQTLRRETTSMISEGLGKFARYARCHYLTSTSS